MKYESTKVVVRNKYICIANKGVVLTEYAPEMHKNVDHYEIHWDGILMGKYPKLKEAIEVYEDLAEVKINLKELLASWQ